MINKSNLNCEQEKHSNYQCDFQYKVYENHQYAKCKHTQNTKTASLQIGSQYKLVMMPSVSTLTKVRPCTTKILAHPPPTINHKLTFGNCGLYFDSCGDATSNNANEPTVFKESVSVNNHLSGEDKNVYDMTRAMHFSNQVENSNLKSDQTDNKFCQPHVINSDTGYSSRNNKWSVFSSASKLVIGQNVSQSSKQHYVEKCDSCTSTIGVSQRNKTIRNTKSQQMSDTHSLTEISKFLKTLPVSSYPRPLPSLPLNNIASINQEHVMSCHGINQGHVMSLPLNNITSINQEHVMSCHKKSAINVKSVKLEESIIKLEEDSEVEPEDERPV